MEMQSPLSSYSVGKFSKLFQPKKALTASATGWALQKALSYCLTGAGTITTELCPFSEEETQLKVTWAMLSHVSGETEGF